jgi:hypothetical protein
MREKRQFIQTSSKHHARYMDQAQFTTGIFKYRQRHASNDVFFLVSLPMDIKMQALAMQSFPSGRNTPGKKKPAPPTPQYLFF